MYRDSWIVFDSSRIDLESAGGRTHLGEVAMHAKDASPKISFPFHEDDAVAYFGSIDGRRDARNSASDN
jgi:hypothetical protein